MPEPYTRRRLGAATFVDGITARPSGIRRIMIYLTHRWGDHDEPKVWKFMLGVYALNEIEKSIEPQGALDSPAQSRGGLRREKHLGPSLYPMVKIAILNIETKKVALPFPCILKTSLHIYM